MEKSKQILIFVRILSYMSWYLCYLKKYLIPTQFLRPCHNWKKKGRQRFPKLFTKMRRIPNVRRWWYFTFDYVPFEKKSSLKEAVASPLDTLFGRYFSSSSSSLLPQSPHSSLHQKPEVMNLAPTREWFTKESFFLIQCALFSCKKVSLKETASKESTT